MSRDILTIMEEMIKVLEKNKELSTRKVALEVGTNWETAIRGLRFLKRVNFVKERIDDKDNRKSKLFSLIKK